MTIAPRRLGRLAAVALAATSFIGACSSDSSSDSSAASGSSTTTTTSADSDGATAAGRACGASGAAASLVRATFKTATAPPKLALSEVAKLEAPTAITTRCDEASLYVTERAGTVVRVHLDGTPGTRSDDGSNGTDTVLDIADRVTAGGEQGLLGLVFTPDGLTLYIAYTNDDANQELDRFTVSADGTVDPASRAEVLTIPDFASNHNGGQLWIDGDGYLYWGMGDGGGGGDPHHSGQDPSDLLGNILRIDPAHPANGKPYGIPASNPFANGGGAPEVFQYGLRNPWRFTFDPATGDEWIADVGQGNYEEIDHVPAASLAGANLGWSAREGKHPYNGGAVPAGAVEPVFEYDHSGGRCAVIGGYVYRGKAIAGLDGTYLYGDACSGDIGGLQLAADGTVAPVDIGLSVGQLSTFGQDTQGELYAASLDGTIVRIDAA